MANASKSSDLESLISSGLFLMLSRYRTVFALSSESVWGTPHQSGRVFWVCFFFLFCFVFPFFVPTSSKWENISFKDNPVRLDLRQLLMFIQQWLEKCGAVNNLYILAYCLEHSKNSMYAHHFHYPAIIVSLLSLKWERNKLIKLYYSEVGDIVTEKWSQEWVTASNLKWPPFHPRIQMSFHFSLTSSVLFCPMWRYVYICLR